MTYKEVYDVTMPLSKRADEKFLYWDRLLRIPATYLTIPFVRWKTKPTTVTKLSLVLLISAFVLISFNTSMLFKIIGWIFILLWGIFDSVDGQLARCTNQCSNLGDLWDTTGGYLAMILIYFSAGIAAYRDCSILPLYEKHISLILGGATAILAIFPRLIMQKKKSYGESSAIMKITDKPSFSLHKIVVQNIISPTAFIQPIFLMAIIMHVLNLFLLFYFVINILVTIVTLRILLK